MSRASDEDLPPIFVSHASDVIGETATGLSGPEIVRLTAARAVEWNVQVPHPTYPFRTGVANKRTALFENLMAFAPAQRYTILRELCDHPTLRRQNPAGVEKLKLMLVARYGHLADESLGTELDAELVARTAHWLGPFPEPLALFEKATQKHASGVFARDVLDDLRLALELLLKALFGNEKSLENQVPFFGAFIKARGGSSELANMFVKLVDYYTKYQNTYVKHDDAIIEEEVEFVFELTSSFMKHLVRLSYK